MIKPGVVNGHLKLPPGQYHLYSSTLSALAGSREQVSLMGYKRTVTPPLAFERGKQNSLLCGAPMEIKVTTTKPTIARTGLNLSRLYDPTTVSDTTLRINASAIGAGGETYSSFAKGIDFKDKPTKPVFVVYDSQGRQSATGDMEYG
jgi:hypothetical protein